MLTHLKNKRAALLQEVDALTAKATTENRSLSEAENTAVSAKLTEIRALKAQIEQAEEIEQTRAAQAELERRAAAQAAAAPRALTGAPAVVSSRGGDARDLEQFSFARAFNALLEGRSLDGIEKEMSQEGENEIRSSGAPRGSGNFVVPSIILRRATVSGTERRDLTATGQTSVAGDQGGMNIQTNVQPIIERLRANLGLVGMGMQTLGNLQGNLSFPIFTADDQAVIKGENVASAESSPTFSTKSMSPRRVPVHMEVSRQLLLQSQNSGIENMLRGDLAYQIAAKLEGYALNGSGSGEPYGILNTVGVGSVAGGTNGAAPTWQNIVDLESAVAVADAAQGSLGYYTNPKVRGKLKTTLKSSGVAGYIWENLSPATPLNENRCGISTVVPSNLTKGTSSGVCSGIIYGNFNDAMMGQWGGLEFLVNPYSLDTTGLIRINCWTFFDFLVRRPVSFAVMKDALTT